jgi:hypothetical protein
MVRRTLVSLTTALAAVLSAGARPLGAQSAVPRAAAYAPAAVSPAPVTVEWAFRRDDLMTCRTSAGELRHLRARFGSQVRIQVVAVDTDAEYVASFLRTERLEAGVTFLSEREYRTRYGNEATPVVFASLPGGGRVVFASGNLTLPSRRSVASLTDFIESLLRPVRVAARPVN